MEKLTCPTCGSPVACQTSGSITQWIASCACFSKSKSNAEHLLSVTISICSICNKRLSINDGSMTQWIFGYEKCSCERPAPAEKEVDAFADNLEEVEEETGLELTDDEDFPHERYIPLAVLGKGAAGRVYLCKDKLLNKKVAVKTLNMLTEDQLIAFQNEAKATSNLRHQNLIVVMDFGATEKGTPYMVMQYFPGISLESYITDYGPLDLSIAREVFLQLSNALDHAHSHSILHRDLKPSNILIKVKDNEITVKLIDFGVARVKEDTGHTTLYQDRALVGTPAYMAPDTASGETFDERSEIYSLGCVMFEAITGKPPFNAPSALQILAKHANESVPVLAELKGFENQKEWSDILKNCLAKSKDDRYDSMKELNEAIKNLPEHPTKDSQFPSSGLAKSSVPFGTRLIPYVIALVLLGSALAATPNLLKQWQEEQFIKSGDHNAFLARAEQYRTQKEWKKAFNWYKKAANAGNIDAMFWLGSLYRDGLGVARDNKEAFYWYSQSADKGNLKAMYNLSIFYKNGIGVEVDRKKAFALSMNAAKKGDVNSMLMVAYCFNKGFGVKKNLKAAFEWYQKAANENSKKGLCNVGFCYERGFGVPKNPVKAFEYTQKSANLGFTQAMYNLGVYYNKGFGVKRSPPLAFKWYLKAAEKGNAKAQCNVGDSYRTGKGTPKDFAEAARWLKKAADQKYVPAYFKLGYVYCYDIASPETQKQGIEYFKKSAEHNEIGAVYNLGDCYTNGIGVEKNYSKAFEWYKKAAENDYASAQRELGRCYYFGVGVEQNYKEAFKWYQKAAAHGTDAKSINKLGICYYYGNGVKQDYRKAVELFKKAVEKDPAEGYELLAIAYRDGKGVKKDPEKAFELYKNAAAKGIPLAQLCLARCYRNGIGVKKDPVKSFVLLRNASNKGYAGAQNDLGNAYYRGEGITRDYVKAFKLFSKAADNGNTMALLNMGVCYKFGNGVKKDITKSIALFKKGIEKGNPAGYKYMGTCYEDGIGFPRDLNKAAELMRKALDKGDKRAKIGLERVLKKIKNQKS